MQSIWDPRWKHDHTPTGLLNVYKMSWYAWQIWGCIFFPLCMKLSWISGMLITILHHICHICRIMQRHSTHNAYHKKNLQHVTSKVTNYYQDTNNSPNSEINILVLPRALKILGSSQIWEKQSETLKAFWKKNEWPWRYLIFFYNSTQNLQNAWVFWKYDGYLMQQQL